MNKKTLFNNYSSAINVSALAESMSGMRVIVIDSVIPNVAIAKLRMYFDIVIATTDLAISYCEKPDIIVSSRLDPHNLGILDLDVYKNVDSILCITQSELNMLKSLSIRHDRHVLSWMPSDKFPSNSLWTVNAIDFGLYKSDPGVHLAHASSAKEIYSASLMGSEFNLKIDNLISEMRGYRPVNILRPKRPNFIEEVRFL